MLRKANRIPSEEEGKAFGFERVYQDDPGNFQNINPQTRSNSIASASGATSGMVRSLATFDDDNRSITSITHTNTHQNARSIVASEVNTETSESSVMAPTIGSIRTKFESIVHYTDPEINRILSLGGSSAKSGLSGFLTSKSSGQGNINPDLAELKYNIKTMWDELNEFLKYCIDKEDEYKDHTRHATDELRKSMNIIFQLQQMKVELEQKDKDIKKLRRDVNTFRDKKADAEKAQNILTIELAEKEKLIIRMEEELAGLRERAGGNLAQLKDKETSEEITINHLKGELMKAIDRVTALDKDLSKKKEEAKRLQTELSQLNRRDAEETEQRNDKIDKLRRELKSYKDTIRTLEDEKCELQEERTMLLDDRSELNKTVSDLEERLSRALEAASVTAAASGGMGSSVLATTIDHNVYIQQLDRIRELTDRVHELEAQPRGQPPHGASDDSELQVDQDLLLKLKEENQQLKSDMLEAKAIMLEAEEDVKRYELENGTLLQELARNEVMRNEFKRLENKLKESLSESRKLRNDIHDLKGNIRVFARIRPVNKDGPDRNEGVCVNVAEDDPKKITIYKRSEGGGRETPTAFTFDTGLVFGPNVSQNDVFEEVADFVQSALDGKCVCLLSYGQTGSGKTHTMQGSGTGEHRGIIPRAMEQVGKYMEKMSEMGWEYSMEVSFVEIYNETLRDLLGGGSGSGASESKRGSISPREGVDDDVKLKIKELDNGYVVVDKATRIRVDPRNDPSQIEVIMRKAGEKRNVGSTAMNAQSSRSHAIFCLHLRGENKRFDKPQVLDGMLSLVDLAGSESVDDSQVTGAQLKETIAINSSLTHLRSVFTSIAKNDSGFINYRDSLLTRLLKSALESGKTLMMINLSPIDSSYGHSLRTLQLGETVSKCKTTSAVVKKKKTKGSGGAGGDGNNSPIPGQVSKGMRKDSMSNMSVSNMTQASYGSHGSNMSKGKGTNDV